MPEVIEFNKIIHINQFQARKKAMKLKKIVVKQIYKTNQEKGQYRSVLNSNMQENQRILPIFWSFCLVFYAKIRYGCKIALNR